MRRCLFFIAVIGFRAYSQPATLAGFSDSGVFALYANEDRLGTLTFEWKPNGSFEAKAVIAIDKQEAASTVSLTPDAEGRWVKALLRGSKDTTTWESDGETLHFNSPDANGKGEWPLDSLTFEAYTPPLMTQALRRYDAATGGAQNFPVILLNLSTFDHQTLTVERLGTRDYNIGARRIALTRWAFRPPGHSYRVLAGPDGKVYAGSGIDGIDLGGISPHHALFVREGYESLLAELGWTDRAKTGPISRPTFDVDIRRGTWISMRDGVKLSTDLYLPKGASKSPVVLVRTPYKKELMEMQGRFFARRGYVFAAQDVRGRFASQGEWTPMVHEAKDGYDSIEWLARQPWSTGKVGMIGASYLGWVPWSAASLHPPHLAAMIPNVSPPDPFHNFPWDNGVLEISSLSWADIVESKATADITGAAMARVDAKSNDELTKQLPVINMDKAALGAESRYWRDWIAHPTPDKYWAGTMFLEKLRKFDIPVFHQSGWFDGDGIGTKLNYLKMAAFGHKNQKLTIGPWEHSDTSSQLAFRHDYGPAAAIDLERDYLRWFDRWLKGMDNGIDREPAVSLFAMGSDKWIYGPSYPLPQTRYEKLYLGAGGVLSFKTPDASQSPDQYTYDPADPTPEGDIVGEHRLEMEQVRKDLLIYTTAPFEKPYTFAGPVSAVLYAASSARDTDWFVHLLDIDEKGKPSTLWANASGGHIRARYRNSLTKPELLAPRKIYEYKIDLWHTALTVLPGHRLRIEVMSAGFPAHDRNLNTGGNNETEATFVKADQTIYHDAAHPSHILLPAIDH